MRNLYEQRPRALKRKKKATRMCDVFVTLRCIFRSSSAVQLKLPTIREKKKKKLHRSIRTYVRYYKAERIFESDSRLTRRPSIENGLISIRLPRHDSSSATMVRDIDQLSRECKDRRGPCSDL